MPFYKQINTNVPSINKGPAASFDLTNSTSECKLRLSREEARRHFAHFIITQDINTIILLSNKIHTKFSAPHLS